MHHEYMNEYTKNEEGESQPQVSIGGSLDEAFKLELCSVVHDKDCPGLERGVGAGR